MVVSTLTLTLIAALLCAPRASAITSFRNEEPIRQLSFSQQGQILTDVQQHQHRFGFPTGDESLAPAQTQNVFPRPAVQIDQPIPIAQNQQQQIQPQFFVQSPTAFQRVPQQPTVPQLVFQPSLITNDQAFLPHPPGLQANVFQQALPNVQPTNSFFQQSQQFNGHQIPLQPVDIPKQQLEAQPPTQHSFLPTIPTQSSEQVQYNFQNNRITPTNSPVQTNVISQSHVDLPFQPSLGTNPLFSPDHRNQFHSLLEEQRKQDLERLKELQERQKIIEKHKQFLERQQQKQQQKVQKLHDEFVQKQKKKQEQIYATAQPTDSYVQNTKSHARDILPHEVGLFQKAVKQFEDLHPTTTPLTTTTTTKATTTQKTKTRGRQRAKSRSEADNSDLYLQSNRQKIYKELKSIVESDDAVKKLEKQSSQHVTPSKLQQLQRQDLLKQLKLAIAENSEDLSGKNFTSREIALPNGERFEVIRTTDPKLIAGATPISADGSSLSQIVSNSPNRIRTSKPPKISFEDISKGVLPPDADYEVIKQSGNGKLEEIDELPPNLTNRKKVTFVFIEEQSDGSYKVKGVRGNDDAKDPEQDVDNILNKIKQGEIQLPAKRVPPSSTSAPRTTTRSRTTFARPTPSSNAAKVYDDFEATRVGSSVTPAPTYYSSAAPSSLSIDHNGSPKPTTPASRSSFATTRSRSSSRFPKTSTVNGHQMHPTPAPAVHYDSSQLVPEFSPVPTQPSRVPDSSILPSPSSYYPNGNLIARSTTTTPKSAPEAAGTRLAYATDAGPDLVQVLKDNGLFATAKYLKQSGLDGILNETGPYTVFAPTDKAFRTLLIQLGGPDKAEEKFKENPRLLSGLLLHHVIPGAFEISSLQDEMTGVSLAGTQLRVNQYDMHDVEWNEIKVTTVNGARVIADKQDISIPQGIAHAVDRVMFPLPVGDVVQTLQADRERRFTNFLKALFASGMAETLSDSRTYTVFAPTDRAFSSLPSDELQKLVTDKESAKSLVLRHITPGTLFSAGMRYYQLRDSMEQEKPITLQKNAGRIKVNSGHVITHNIPTTNGVIHAIDTLL